MYFWHYPFYSPVFVKVSGREKRQYEKNWDPYLKEAIFSVLLKVEYSVQKMGNKQNVFLLSVVNAGLE